MENSKDKQKFNQTKYINEFKKQNLKRIPLEVSKEKYEQIKEHTSKTDESVNGFIKRAIDQTMESDNLANPEE